jgi:hypothetical protein
MLEHDAFGYRFTLERDDGNKNYKRMSAGFAGCDAGGVSAWGDTSDHLEYQSQAFVWAGGNETLLQALFADEGKTQNVDWGIGTSNYGTPNDPASPSQTQGTIMRHGFTGESMTNGDTYRVKMRLLMNINSPSHL